MNKETKLHPVCKIMFDEVEAIISQCYEEIVERNKKEGTSQEDIGVLIQACDEAIIKLSKRRSKEINRPEVVDFSRGNFYNLKLSLIVYNKECYEHSLEYQNENHSKNANS
jgi:hypothetical protein